MDAMAKETAGRGDEEFERVESQQHRLAMQMPKHKDNLITQDLSRALYECVADERIKQHWIMKGRVKADQMKNIE